MQDLIRRINLKRRLLGCGILYCLAVALLALVYHLAYAGTVSYTLYWVAMLLFVLSTAGVVISRDTSRRDKVIFVFMFGLALYLAHLMRASHNFIDGDELLHASTTKLIGEEGSLAVRTSFSFPLSFWYPGLSLTNLPLSEVSGLSIYASGRILIGLVHSLSLVFVYLFSQELRLSPQVCGVGALVYTVNTQYGWFETLYSYESLGSMFVALLVFLISRMATSTDRVRVSLMAILVVAALTITHHFSSYMFLLFLVMVAIIQQFTPKADGGKGSKRRLSLLGSALSGFAMMSVVLVGYWLVYAASGAVNYLAGILVDRVRSFIAMTIPGGTRVGQFYVMSGLPRYETFINTYIYPPFMLVASIAGAYLLIRKLKLTSALHYAVIVYGVLLYLATWPLILSRGADLAYRSWTFFFFGTAPVVSIALVEAYNHRNALFKVLSVGGLLLLMLSGISMSASDQVRFPGQRWAIGPDAYTADLFAADRWFAEKLGRYNTILGDSNTYDIFTRGDVQDVNYFSAYKLFFPQRIEGQMLDEFIGYDYLVTNRIITKYLSIRQNYFGLDTRSLKDYPPYGLTQPLPPESLDKFNFSPFFRKIYDNGNINIYQMDWQRHSRMSG